MTSAFRSSLAVLLSCLGSSLGRAQCLDWAPGFDLQGVNSDVDALAVFDDGSGPALFAGGQFTTAGFVTANFIARWDGANWSAVGGGASSSVRALAVYDDGSGPALYAGGDFSVMGGVAVNGIAKWDGTAWSAVGGGVNGYVSELGVFDDGSGPGLYAGGSFTSAGGVSASRIARWNGSSWSALGTGIAGPSTVESMAVFDDGAGPALYVGGTFLSAGGITANRIARWNGSAWSSLGSGTSCWVAALAVFDDGAGPALYAGGCFATAGGVAVNYVARWKSGTWSAVAGGMGGGGGLPYVHALAVFDDGAGAALYAAGGFTTAGGAGAARIAKWDGGVWTPLGGGLSGGPVTPLAISMAAFDDGTGGGPDLYVGGRFETAGAFPSLGFAEWRGCASGESFCFGDGTTATPCPCGNTGLPGSGCENSSATGGAQLSVTGLPSLTNDTIVFTASGERPTALSIFLQGNTEFAGGIPFGDGVRCIGGVLKRLFVRNAVGGTVAAPVGGDPSVHVRSRALGDGITSAQSRSYQVYYRDNVLTFCPSPAGNAWNVGHAVRLTWIP